MTYLQELRSIIKDMERNGRKLEKFKNSENQEEMYRWAFETLEKRIEQISNIIDLMEEEH